ncbi:UDP-glycosyltransferase UGT5-like, partial [Aphidius gifuensis]|uniref:UDP-glycosyltransferase UGT5-like n=1 Tax=Aphidius gifuensis TaxID=684658 RepID=UPI001CDD87E9
IEIDNCVGYRILGLFPLNVKSHFKMYERLMKGLVERGHQVDVISCFPLDTPIKNYTDIVIDELAAEHIDEFTYDLLPVYNGLNQFKVIATMVGNDVCDGIVKNSKVQDIINNPPKNPPYDLIIMELVAGNCFMALGHKLNIPVIAVSSSFWPWTSAITPQDEIIKKTFGPSTPGLMELEKQFDLFLLNTHPSLDDPIPRVPGLIEVGGLHALNDDGPELSVADKKWLDESTDGFIYFTFGSFAVTESFPLSTIQAFYKSFAKLAPIRILMKVKQPERLPPGLPDNVKIFTWISQPKVLKHKNIRAFITHGGLMGTQEAVLYGVPMIGVPLFCDQFTNVDLYVRKNIAIRLEHKEITEQKLDFALKEILKNPMYRNNAKKLAIKFRDRPSSPLDTACYWIEYIGRHGKNALRSPTLDLAWWQVQLLDVYAAVLFAITIILIIST